MTKEIMLYVLISVVSVAYLVITGRYFFVLRKSIIFTGSIRTFHLVMIWLVPFIWVFLLKSLTRSLPGSYQVENKREPRPFSDVNRDVIRASHM